MQNLIICLSVCLGNERHPMPIHLSLKLLPSQGVGTVWRDVAHSGEEGPHGILESKKLRYTCGTVPTQSPSTPTNLTDLVSSRHQGVTTVDWTQLGYIKLVNSWCDIKMVSPQKLWEAAGKPFICTRYQDKEDYEGFWTLSTLIHFSDPEWRRGRHSNMPGCSLKIHPRWHLQHTQRPSVGSRVSPLLLEAQIERTVYVSQPSFLLISVLAPLLAWWSSCRLC